MTTGKILNKVYNIKKGSHTVRFIIGSLDVGGTEQHLSTILPALLSDTFRPVVITLTHKGVLARHLEQNGIEVIAPTGLLRWVQRVPILSRIFGLLGTIIYLIGMYKKIPARLTCFYLPSSYYLGMIAALITREARMTVMFRRSLNDYQRSRFYIGYIERWLHEKTGAIVGNSQAVIKQLLHEEHVPEDKLTLIYNGVNLEKYNPPNIRVRMRAEFGVADDVVILCIVANLIPYKGHADLINALAMISHKTSRPWNLFCVGEGIEKRKDLLDLVEYHHLTRQVRWLGVRSDVPAILSAADLGLLVSYQEGFSNSLIEGMAAGLPMVVTNVGGNPEAVIHEQSGLVVEPGDPDKLSQAILRLINDRNLARCYGENARKRVEKMFSMTSCIQSYRQFFQDH